MKWCMVAAMAVSLLFGGVAQAQDDNFDLDALLGDAGASGETAPADAAAVPAVDEAAVAPAAEALPEEAAAPAEELAPAAEAVPAVAEEAVAEAAAAPAEELAPVAEEAAAAADPFADLAAEAPAVVEEAAAPAAEEIAAPAEELAPAAEEAVAAAEEAVPAAEEAAPAADPFADLAAEAPAAEELAPVAEEVAAPAEELAPMAEEAVVPMEEAVAPVAAEEAAAPAAEADLLGDLFAEPAADVAAPAEELAPAAEELAPMDDLAAEEPVADFTDEGGAIAPAASKKGSKEVEKLPAKELKKLAKETAEQEEVRRQAAEADALKSSEAGFKALTDGDLVAAENAFTSALKNLPDRPQNAAVRDQIAWGLAEAQYLRARGMVQKNERLEDARKLVDSALANAKDHRGAQALDKKLAKLEALAAMPKEPADQPATIEKAADIEKMYDEARQWYMLKDYDRASALFEKILVKDPYHKSAMRYLRKIEADKFKLATYQFEASRQGMVTEVRRSWSPPASAQIELPEDQPGQGGVDSQPASQRLQEKMKNIVIPAVEFRQANITDVVNFLVEASIAADPEKEGVNIILNLGQSGGGAFAAPAPAPAAPAEEGADAWGDLGVDTTFAEAPVSGGGGNIRDITLNLRRISMLDAIKYITEVAGLKYRIEDSAVIITPIDAPVGNIITRMYPVQPSFMDVIVERAETTAEDRDAEFTSMGGRVSMTKSDVKDFFEKTGVKFPQGASITYNATISQLIVANTADNLETFERILQQLNVVPNQVEIEARFIEVAQGDLEELGLQWILNDNYEFATATDGSGGRMQVNANNNGLTQGNRFFNYNSDTAVVAPASPITQIATQTPLGSILSASSVLTNPEVTVVLQALSQHGGSDMLSAPRVTTRSGVNAQIQVVKEIIYPTEFDSEIITLQREVAGGGTIQELAATVTPGTFETRETGVILNVTPTVGPDGYTIDLVMAPEVAELVDWIQYGGAVGEFFFNMPQPIFTSRNITTSIVIWDGQTVVMGGMIREELTTIKDKIPILGDIPVLGWLFRSEGQNSRKMNLLIFVTARLVDPAGRPIHREGNMALPGSGIEAAPDAAAAVME